MTDPSYIPDPDGLALRAEHPSYQIITGTSNLVATLKITHYEAFQHPLIEFLGPDGTIHHVKISEEVGLGLLQDAQRGQSKQRGVKLPGLGIERDGNPPGDLILIFELGQPSAQAKNNPGPLRQPPATPPSRFARFKRLMGDYPTISAIAIASFVYGAGHGLYDSVVKDIHNPFRLAGNAYSSTTALPGELLDWCAGASPHSQVFLKSRALATFLTIPSGVVASVGGAAIDLPEVLLVELPTWASSSDPTPYRPKTTAGGTRAPKLGG